MFKRPTALCAAAAVALATLAPAPALALDAEQQRNILFGAAALGLLAAAIQHHENRSRDDDDDRHRSAAHGLHSRSDPAPAQRRHHHGRTALIATPSHRTAPPRQYRHNAIPSNCIRRVNTQRGPRNLVGAPCLRQNQVSLARLPNSCRRDLQIGGRQINAWLTRCLQDRGFRFR